MLPLQMFAQHPVVLGVQLPHRSTLNYEEDFHGCHVLTRVQDRSCTGLTDMTFTEPRLDPSEHSTMTTSSIVILI